MLFLQRINNALACSDSVLLFTAFISYSFCKNLFASRPLKQEQPMSYNKVEKPCDFINPQQSG